MCSAQLHSGMRKDTGSPPVPPNPSIGGESQTYHTWGRPLKIEEVGVTVTVILLVMLSSELAEFFGVDDQALRSDFIGFLNGMLGYAEANRKSCWEKLCGGMGAVCDELKQLRIEKPKFQEREKELREMSSLLDETRSQVQGQIKLIEELNSSNREYIAQIETVKAENLVLIENSKRAVCEKNLKNAKRVSRDPSPTVADEDPSAKRDKNEAVIRLRERVTSLMAENEHLTKENALLKTENGRLDGLVSALSNFEVAEVEVVKRISLDEANKLRKQLATVKAQLQSTGEEARNMAHKYTEYIKENDAQWQKKVIDLKNQVDEFKKASGAPPPPISTHPTTILVPSAFGLLNGNYMSCPVPIRTGRAVPLVDVYTYWRLFPCDNEGTFFSSFKCPYTGQNTSLASIEQVQLVHIIAMDLRLFAIPPLRFQHFSNGNWLDFTFIDQIIIAALCCKVYRLEATRTKENVMVCRGDFIFTIHTNDNVIDFNMQPVHNSTKLIPVCLMECVPNFFQRWSFPAVNQPAVDQE